MTRSPVPFRALSTLSIVLLSLMCQGTTTAQDNPKTASRRVDLEPCGFATYGSKVLCGKYEVFEDRAARAGRKFSLDIVMLPALASDPAPDPVFFLAGGPGQGAARIASLGEDSLMTELRRHRDLVFVDQRGTGNSHPLNCDLSSGPAAAQSFFEELFPLEKVRACRAALQRIADLKLYTTPIAMGDLNEVRDALGYEKINLYGVSYGTMAALQYLREYPRHVRALALAGVATPAARLPLHFAKGAQAAMRRMIDDCAAENDCRSTFPDLKADFARVLAILDRGPVNFQAPHPKTKELQDVKMSRGVFAERIKNLLYHVSSTRLLPLLIHHAAEGDWTVLGKIVTGTHFSPTHAPAMGMYLTVTCSESVPFINEDEIPRETNGTFMGDYRTRTHLQVCREWPRGPIPAAFHDPVISTLPVLMLSGQLDGATPEYLASAAAKSLSNGRQVSLPNTAHEYGSECARNIIAQFIASGSARDLNTSCASALRRPPYAQELPARFAR